MYQGWHMDVMCGLIDGCDSESDIVAWRKIKRDSRCRRLSLMVDLHSGIRLDSLGKCGKRNHGV